MTLRLIRADDGSWTASLELPQLDVRRSRFPLLYAPITEEFYPGISQIAVLWGCFENDFRDLLACLMDANGTPDRRSLEQSFETKRRQMKKEIVLLADRPALLAYISDIIRDAQTIQKRRNLLLHGELKIQIDIVDLDKSVAPKAEVTLYATGRNGSEQLSLTDINQLASDIGHLAGRMNEFRTSNPQIAGLSAEDADWLNALLARYHPAHQGPKS